MEFASFLLSLLEAPASSSALTLIIGMFILLYTSGHGKALSEVQKVLFKDKKQKGREHFNILQLNNYVIRKMDALLDYLMCDRILIFQYHNGESGFNHSSFAKMTCTHEAIRKVPLNHEKSHKCLSVEYQKDFINLPITAYHGLLGCILERKMRIFVNIKDIYPISSATYAELKRHGAKSAVIIPMFNLDNHIVGFCILEYCLTKLIRTEDLMEKILDSTARLSTLLEDSGAYSKEFLKEMYGAKEE